MGILDMVKISIVVEAYIRTPHQNALMGYSFDLQTQI
tara:strand:+ start:158088 stop:158198 length:111 start_codon:yes stop_codon:yes gene_type:complete